MDRPSKSLGKQKMPSFFKVLITDFSNRLQIPPAFIKQFGKDVPKKALLENYFHRSWKVEVEKLENKFYLSDGWKKFVEHNYLEHGDFLVFKYFADHSKFKVKIYGKTFCEKQSDVGRERCSEPLHGKKDQRKGQDRRRRKRNEVADNVHRDQESKAAKRTKTQFNRSKAFHRDVLNIDSDSSFSSSSDDEDEIDAGEVGKQETKAPTIQFKRKEKCTTLPPGDYHNHIEFTSENPWFDHQLKHTSVNFYLYIPKGFFRKHMMNENKRIKFEMSHKTWKMELLVHERDTGGNKGNKEARINQGWKRYVKEYDLEVGDVCFFEVIRSGDFEYVFRVPVYRWNPQEEEFYKKY